MTSRLLLTFLAILTGLYAPEGRVLARDVAPSTAEVAQVSALSGMRAAKSMAVLARPATGRSRSVIKDGANSCPDCAIASHFSVRVGIDRARE